MSFVSESISTGFGVDGVTIGQTLLYSFDPYSGMDVNTNNFKLNGNTKESLEDSNQDGRIELGMFTFDDENNASDSFPDILPRPLTPISKRNLVRNGNCRFVEKDFVVIDDFPIVVKPEGDWMFLSLYEDTSLDYDSIENGPEVNYNFFDSQKIAGYGGRYNYVPLSLELDNGNGGFNYWGRIERAFEDGVATEEEVAEYFGSSLGRYHTSFDYGQARITASIDNLADVRAETSFYGNPGLAKNSNTVQKPIPHIAMWIQTPEAYSDNRCLCFVNYSIFGKSQVLDYTYTDGNKYIFNWFMKNDLQQNGKPDDGLTYDTDNVNHYHQERVLNQVQQIYNKFNDEPINPYSSLKIKFKMKTTNVLPTGNTIVSEMMQYEFRSNPLTANNGYYAPKVEVGILKSQFHELPKSGVNSIRRTHGLDNNDWNDHDELFKSPGAFNSSRYTNANHGSETVEFEQRNYSKLGGMSRFQNSIMNEWETFEFTFSLTDEHLNTGLIYGVPYGGTFNDDLNGGPVEIMLNHQFGDDGGPFDSNSGEIYLKPPNVDNTDDDGNLDIPSVIHITAPNGQNIQFNHDGEPDIDDNGTVTYAADYMTINSDLGDTSDGGGEQKTGPLDNGRFLEAYLMYVGVNHPSEESNENQLKTGVQGINVQMVVAYWDGERWSYDKNNTPDNGYKPSHQFKPNENCFILARLYAQFDDGAEDDEKGITGMDQYISNESEFPTSGVGNLHLFLQTGNNFQGRVLIDDIECYESYDFIPEVDVRKKISVGNYGIADLTKYYDKDLQPDEYKDSQAPLEAQFYFYPQYPSDEIFDVERTPIYQDFKLGRFYIYDVDWGDGTAVEFRSNPQKIDENTALYHTYESSGVFEVTGTMFRVKVDEENNVIGVLKNKRFNLRISVNEGIDEDFQYFGSDGYSFIPFKNTTPIIGGISKQSSYYKKIKRQLGFLGQEKINIEFKTKGDKLKTESALLKMENQSNDDLELLPNYLVNRYITKITAQQDDSTKIYNGLNPIREELGKGIGDCDLTNIKYYDEPKSIWELFGFEDVEFNEIGNPENPRYWKKIIPEDYSIFRRAGIPQPDIDITPEYLSTLPFPQYKEELDADGNGIINPVDATFWNREENELFRPDIADLIIGLNIGMPPSSDYIYPDYVLDWFNTSIPSGNGLEQPIENFSNMRKRIDIYSEQDWIDNYYYPVLPKYGSDGNFIDGNFPNNKIPFPQQGSITDESEQNQNLLINIVNEKIETDIINDNSGNNNYGFFIQDFSPIFDEESLKVMKTKRRNLFNTTKQNGAF